MASLPTDPKRQKQLVIGLLPLVALLGYWYFFHGSITDEIGTMETRLEQLEANNTQARAVAARGGPELERRLELYRSHIARLETLIPTSEEVPELLHAMNTEAQNTGVEVAFVQPVGEEIGPYYTRRFYEVRVLGAYHDVGRFLASIGSLQRIITPTDLVLSVSDGASNEPGESPELQAVLRLETYVLPAPVTQETTESGNA